MGEAEAGDTRAEGSTPEEVGGDRRAEEGGDRRVVEGKGDRPEDETLAADAAGIAGRDYAREAGTREVERAEGTDTGCDGWEGKTWQARSERQTQALYRPHRPPS